MIRKKNSDWLLPALLSTTAGAVDVIGFLALGGLFTAHITGNLVVLAAHYITGRFGEIAPLLSVPMFVVVLGVVTLTFVRKPVWIARRALLVLQAVLLACFLGFGAGFGPFENPDSGMAVFVGMLGVASMAIQNGLVRLALPGAPSTAVMTTNVTQFTVDFATLVRGHDESNDLATVRRRADLTLASVIGFLIGLAVGAVLEIHFGFWSSIFPAILAAASIPLGERWPSHTQPYAFDDNGVLRALPAWGVAVGYTRQWTDKWRSTVSYGYANVETEKSKGPFAFDHSDYVSAVSSPLLGGLLVYSPRQFFVDNRIGPMSARSNSCKNTSTRSGKSLPARSSGPQSNSAVKHVHQKRPVAMDQMRNFSGLGDVTTRGQEKVFAVVSRHAIINGKKSEHVVIFDDHPASLCLLRELQLTPPRQNLFRYAMLAVLLIVALCLAMFWPLL